MQYYKSLAVWKVSDGEIYLLFEKGIGSGVYYTSERYSKVNNMYLKSYYWKQK